MTEKAICSRCNKPVYSPIFYGEELDWCGCGLLFPVAPGTYYSSNVEEWQTGHKTVPTWGSVMLLLKSLEAEVVSLSDQQRTDYEKLIRRQAAALATIRNMIEGRNSIDDPEKRLVMADSLMDEILMVIAEVGDGSDLPNSET